MNNSYTFLIQKTHWDEQRYVKHFNLLQPVLTIWQTY